MAAFENISKIVLTPYETEEVIDVRTYKLPSIVEESTYDPRAQRKPKKPIKMWMAYLNLLRIGFGAGVLGFPLAISQAGIIVGPLLSIFTGFLLLHTHTMLLNCLNEISRRLKVPNISYRYGFRLALLHGPPLCHGMGNCGPTIIAIFMIMSQIGICTVFVDFTTDSLRDIMDFRSSRQSMLCLLPLYLILLYFTKSLKVVSYISMLGNIMNLSGLILIFYLIFKEPRGQVENYATDPLPFLFAFGTFLFNISVVGVVLSLDKALADPHLMVKKGGLLTIGILAPTAIATIFGCLGYWSFGTMEENVLRSLPYDDYIALTAIGLYMISIALAYPLQCFPGIQILLEVIKNHDFNHVPSQEGLDFVENVSRPILVLITFTISYYIPFQGPFVAFVGNLCTTMLSLVFPAMMELCLMYPGPYGKFRWRLIKNVLIIVLGLTSWLFGILFCGNLIYVRLVASKSPNDSEYF